MGNTRSVKDWINGYCELLEFTESPNLYKKWVAISAIASALRRKCFLRWFPHVRTHPNMYIVLTGPPAIGKGMAMGPSMEMLKKLDIRLSAQSATRQALIQNMLNAEEVTTRNGYMYKESNLTIFSKEFSVFLGQNNKELIDNLTDWWDVPNDWTYETIGRGEEKINGLYVNLIGATTPTGLQGYLTSEAITNGLMSRIILVYEDKKSRLIPIPTLGEEMLEKEGKLMADLRRIADLEGEFRFTDDFPDVWVDWYMENEKHHFRKDSRLSSYAGRRVTHMLKLLMVVSASRRDSMIITVSDFERAKELLEEAEESMEGAFRGYGANVLSQYIEVIMNEIQVAKYLYFKDLVKRHSKDVSIEDLEKILNTLQQMGFCDCVRMSSGVVIKYTPENLATQQIPEAED